MPEDFDAVTSTMFYFFDAFTGKERWGGQLLHCGLCSTEHLSGETSYDLATDTWTCYHGDNKSEDER